jgi:peptidoglycan/LPS O-acetylase OafA/YrhL
MTKEYLTIGFFRALAAFWVLLAHCLIWSGWHGPQAPNAKLAVDLFMMISGFLMVANAEAREDREPMGQVRTWGRFFLRRYFRLAPAYYLSLALVLATSTWFLAGYGALRPLNDAMLPAGGLYDPATIRFTPTNVFLHVTLAFGLFPRYAFSTFLPDWSLSLEMQFYLLLPILVLLLRRVGPLRLTLWVGLPVFIAGWIVSSRVAYGEPSLILFGLNYFLAGMLMCWMLSLPARRDRWVCAACGLLLVSLDLRYGRQLLLLPLLFCAMAQLLRLEMRDRLPSWLARVFRSRAVHFGSDASYAVYLFHGLFIAGCGLLLIARPELAELPPVIRSLGMLTVVTLLSYGVAWGVHRWIEQPGIRLGRHVIERLVPQRAQARGASVPRVS